MSRFFLRFSLVALILIAVASWYWLGREDSSSPPVVDQSSHADPQAPDVLRIEVIEEDAANGRLSADIVVQPGMDGETELEILSPAGLRFANGLKKRSVNLPAGAAAARERVELRAAPGESAALRVELRVLDDRGQPKFSITRERILNPSAPAAPTRVPVVHTLPDGSRIVEYVPTNAMPARRP